MQSSKPGRKGFSGKSLVIMVLAGVAVAFILVRLTRTNVETWNLNRTIGWGKQGIRKGKR